VCDQHADTVILDKAADLDWLYIMDAVILNDDQVWWEKVRLRDVDAVASSSKESSK
jgi:hypothetical protein